MGGFSPKLSSFLRGDPMAKPNYSFEKRQREIAQKKKKEEKLAQKQAARDAARPAPPAEPENDSDSDSKPE
jgi:hypothetical protein